ncbi:hypothetical protein CC1G_05629 [Coprinopsis cinerea okayama7|uniref:Uncharacterized protein n=1 Tax=Coprinopsis cinerea (strain Okayama-7 / 130 / ATCC MYA-4618 / FGSC 9003) TaxID=240176 RepID=A8P1P8_COPC7|nr:hypothetical protein CC1G_05629 [Coprinopsis cinerea okayama7\|eukprot:XP_001838148.2 hypothetical protein CC1G_05629 [Coprinopsis cinerea okayama7\
MKGCLTWTPNVERTLAAWIPCIVVTFMFFVFTMAKLRRSVIGSRFTKDWSFITLLQDSSNFSPLLMILMRDGSLYFFAIFASLATQATIQVYMQGLYFTSVHPWLHVVFSCACSRLVLNLYNYGGGTDSLHCSTYVRDEQELRVIRFVGQNTYIRDPGNRS